MATAGHVRIQSVSVSRPALGSETPKRSFFGRLFFKSSTPTTQPPPPAQQKSRFFSAFANRSHPNLTTSEASRTGLPIHRPLAPISLGEGSSAAPPPTGTRECSICANEFPAAEFPANPPSPRCQHEPVTCAACLARHLETEITERGAVPDFSCPSAGCKARLLYPEVQRLATRQVFQRYDTLLLRQSLGRDGTFVWCKNTRCGHGQIHYDGHAAPIVICSACRHKTCFTHDSLWHEGLTCSEVDAAARRKKEEEEEAKKPINKAGRALRAQQDVQAREFIKRDTRQCPGCMSPIQKNGGCDNMSCRCGRAFKWSAAVPTRS